jgi:isopenicillin N synthase-like dioxygenase
MSARCHSLVPTKQLEPMQMPVIDFSRLHQTDKSRSQVIREIAAACRDIGCFQVRDTLTQ